VIPRLIHQTAKTASVSPKWAPLVETARRLHPDWTYRLWTDEDNLALIRERRPDLEAVYRALPRPVMRADLIRYVFMEQFGGLYFDTDYQWLKPFDLTDRALVLPVSSDPGAPLALGNAVFASRAGHPFWTAALEEIRGAAAADEVTENDVIQRTGPGLLTRVYRERFAEDPSIHLPPRAEFHPAVPATDAALAALTADPRAFGIHWCFGTWRALTWRARMVQKLGRWLRGRR